MKVGNITVYRNVYRREDDGAPHYRGKMDIGDKEYQVALWINDTITDTPINLSGQVTVDD